MSAKEKEKRKETDEISIELGVHLVTTKCESFHNGGGIFYIHIYERMYEYVYALVRIWHLLVSILLLLGSLYSILFITIIIYSF